MHEPSGLSNSPTGELAVARTSDAPPSRHRGTRSLALIAAVMAVVGDRLFVADDGSAATLGCNVALFALALLVVVLGWRLSSRGLRSARLGRQGTIVLLALLGLIATLALDPGWIAMAIVAALLWSLARGLAVGWPRRAILWFAHASQLPSEILSRWIADSALAKRWQRRHRGGRRGGLDAAILRWLGPAIIAAVFVAVFVAANPVIEAWMSEASSAVRSTWSWLTTEVSVGRVLLWAATLALTWAFLRGRVRRWRVPTDAVSLPHAREAFLVRTLVLCNAVFAVQTGLDLLYLSGGSALPPGMTFAGYAHRGAYPLIAAALLAGLFTLITFRSGSEGERSPWARRLVSLWIAQSVLLTATAGWRLWLYVEQYSLSRWRLATVIWLAIVAIGLSLLIERLRRRASLEWYLSRTLIGAVAILVACVWPDLDGFIARYNVAHCREVGSDAAPIDLGYLEGLGASAIPALERLASTSQEPKVAEEAAASARRMRERLDRDLRDWRGWTLRRAWLQSSRTE
jgi:hypothetical protein